MNPPLKADAKSHTRIKNIKIRSKNQRHTIGVRESIIPRKQSHLNSGGVWHPFVRIAKYCARYTRHKQPQHPYPHLPPIIFQKPAQHRAWRKSPTPAIQSPGFHMAVSPLWNMAVLSLRQDNCHSCRKPCASGTNIPQFGQIVMLPCSFLLRFRTKDTKMIPFG